MKCVLNPISGEIKRLATQAARDLVGYGWRYVSKAEWKAYKATSITKSIKLSISTTQLRRI